MQEKNSIAPLRGKRYSTDLMLSEEKFLNHRIQHDTELLIGYWNETQIEEES